MEFLKKSKLLIESLITYLIRTLFNLKMRRRKNLIENLSFERQKYKTKFFVTFIKVFLMECIINF